MTEKSHPPALGITIEQVIEGWKASRSFGTLTVNGHIIAGGANDYYFDQHGKMMVAVPFSKGKLASTRPVSDVEMDDVYDAIKKGMFQIELRSPKGLSEPGRGNVRFILHQATGRVLPRH